MISRGKLKQHDDIGAIFKDWLFYHYTLKVIQRKTYSP